MNLCTYSKSEVLQRDILPRCPLALTGTEAKRCPCRKREYHVTEYDLRVLSCTHPHLFDGSEIYDEARLVANLRRAEQIEHNDGLMLFGNEPQEEGALR